MIQFCTTRPDEFMECDRHYTAPASAFDDDRKIGYLQGRGWEDCGISLRGYIHGEIEMEAGFDIPTLCRGEILLDHENGLEIDCEVWVNQEETRRCIMFVWPSNSSSGKQEFICWKKNSGTSHASFDEALEYADKLRAFEERKPEEHRENIKIEQVFRHLIVGEEDWRGIEYARKCLAKKEWRL